MNHLFTTDTYKKFWPCSSYYAVKIQLVRRALKQVYYTTGAVALTELKKMTYVKAEGYLWDFHMPGQKGHCSFSSGGSSLMPNTLVLRPKLSPWPLHTMPQSGKEKDSQEWQNSNRLYREIRSHLRGWREFTQVCWKKWPIWLWGYGLYLWKMVDPIREMSGNWKKR